MNELTNNKDLIGANVRLEPTIVTSWQSNLSLTYRGVHLRSDEVNEEHESGRIGSYRALHFY